MPTVKRTSEQKKRQTEYAMKKYHAKRDLLKKAKEVPCAMCGKVFPSYMMDFHHRDPDSKTFTLGRDHQRRGTKQLKDEISKCDVLCANCHRHVTYAPNVPDGCPTGYIGIGVT